MRKITSAVLVLCMILCLSLPVLGESAGTHSEEKYLTDTLTLAGSAFEQIRTLTVSAVEAMAADESLDIAYEGEYSMMTSGSVFSKHTFTGVKLLELLLNEGMDDSLGDSTPVKFISKDGYTISVTLGDLRGGSYNRYSAKGGELEAAGVPVIVAYASDGQPLIGPTGDESVYKRFEQSNGYVEGADNIGGPLRLVIGQRSSYEFNAPCCSKWLAAVVVGDDNGYAYTRDSAPAADASEPDPSGDWTHGGTQSSFTLKISGSEAEPVYFSLAELEAMSEGTVRSYFAASAGRNAYEGVTLKYLISRCLKDGIDVPSSIVIKASDGFEKRIDVNTVMKGIDSLYQPGQHKDVLLAWAIDGSPLVPGKDSEGYDGTNAYGPLRLIVENTISMWVKNVCEIVLGEPDNSPYADISENDPVYGFAIKLHDAGIMNGVGGGYFDPAGNVSRAQLVTMLWRAKGCPVVNYYMTYTDVDQSSWYGEAVRWASSEKLVNGYSETAFGPDDGISRQQLAAVLYRFAASPQVSGSTDFPDGASAAAWGADALVWAVENGVLDTVDGTLSPDAPASRADAAKALCRSLGI